MRKKHLLAVLTLFITSVTCVQITQAQKDSCKFATSLGVDLVSTYIWRGTVSDQSPNIQPTFSLSNGNFSLGVWGSSNFTGTYKEVDLFASYTLRRFTLTVTDYQWSPFIDSISYFNYNNDETGHIVETSLGYKGGEKFPISIMASTFIYGNDKKQESDGKVVNQYSTYVECLYPFTWKSGKMDVFLGLTTDKGYYGDSYGVVNLGVTSYKTIKVSNSFELPMKGSLIFNPQAGRIYLMLGITL